MENLLGQRPRRESISIALHDRSRRSLFWSPMSTRPSAVRGRLAAPWFRIHPAEHRVGQLVPAKSGALPLRLVIAFAGSNGA